MEDALRASRTCAVFIGKKLGPWQNEEMRTALAKRVKNRSYRVIPVLLPGGPEAGLDDLSEFLGRLTWVDFRAGLDDEDAFRRLLAGIRGEAPGPGGRGEEKRSRPFLYIDAWPRPGSPSSSAARTRRSGRGRRSVGCQNGARFHPGLTRILDPAVVDSG